VYNATALADDLSLGEAVTMEANITYNNSMIRAPDMTLWTNITATSAAENETVTSSIKIIPTRCQTNSTSCKYCCRGYCNASIAVYVVSAASTVVSMHGQ
jgi:hypothetical protein